MKGVLISLEMLVAVMAFTVAFSLFLIRTSSAQQTINTQYTNIAEKLSAEAKIQNVVYQIDKLNPSPDMATGILNSTLPYKYRLAPFGSFSTLGINRVIVLGGVLYDLEVFTNETPVQH